MPEWLIEWLIQHSGHLVGTIIGTLGAGLVAVFATHRTDRLARERHATRQENLYRNALFAMHTELSWHKNHAKRLREQIPKIEHQSVEKGQFIVGQGPDPFDLSYIKSLRLRLVEYEYVDKPILALLDGYINVASGVNRNLNFSVARELITNSQLEDPADRIKEYFLVLEEDYLSNVLPVLKELREQLEAELSSYPVPLHDPESNIQSASLNT